MAAANECELAPEAALRRSWASAVASKIMPWTPRGRPCGPGNAEPFSSTRTLAAKSLNLCDGRRGDEPDDVEAVDRADDAVGLFEEHGGGEEIAMVAT
mmetsp:Transcript_62852/g.192245  ORF Transcript_62852/g.192245 Transcript_62852/m.192245 type:complete len:98 (-) Transcript_62852:75-368(-)